MSWILLTWPQVSGEGQWSALFNFLIHLPYCGPQSLVSHTCPLCVPLAEVGAGTGQGQGDRHLVSASAYSFSPAPECQSGSGLRAKEVGKH